MSLWTDVRTVVSPSGYPVTLTGRIREGGIGSIGKAPWPASPPVDVQTGFSIPETTATYGSAFKRASNRPYVQEHIPDFECSNASYRYFFTHGVVSDTVHVDRYEKTTGDITDALYVDSADLTIKGMFHCATVTDAGVITVLSEQTVEYAVGQNWDNFAQWPFSSDVDPYDPTAAPNTSSEVEMWTQRFSAAYAFVDETLQDHLRVDPPMGPLLETREVRISAYHTHLGFRARLYHNTMTDSTSGWVLEVCTAANFTTLYAELHVGDFSESSSSDAHMFSGEEDTGNFAYDEAVKYYFRVRCTMNGVALVSNVVALYRVANQGWTDYPTGCSSPLWTGDEYYPIGDSPKGYIDSASILNTVSRYGYEDTQIGGLGYTDDQSTDLLEFTTGEPTAIAQFTTIPAGDIEVLDNGSVRYLTFTSANIAPVVLVKSSGTWTKYEWTPSAGLDTSDGAFYPHLYLFGATAVYLSSFSPSSGTGKKVVYIPLSTSGFGTATVWSFAGITETYGTYQGCQVSYDHVKLFQHGEDESGNYVILVCGEAEPVVRSFPWVGKFQLSHVTA